MKIKELLVNSLAEPLGIDSPQPTFSWKLIAKEKNVQQTAYQIIVLQNQKEFWNTGKKNSNQSTFVEYQGKPLEPREKYQVQIKVWDNLQQMSEKVSEFETGVFGGQNLAANWIGLKKETQITGCPIFFKDFQVKSQLTSARLYISAHGIYEADLNSEKVGDAFFTPGWTNYHQRIQYQTYDVTDLLKANNHLTVTVANGWYKGELGFMPEPNHYGKQLAAIAELELHYADGSKQVIATDDTWQATEGKVRSAEFYNGEFQDTTWNALKAETVEVLQQDKQVLVAQEDELVKVIKEFPVKKIFQTPRGETVLDFGQNIAGGLKLSITGKKGQRIKLRHAEALDEKGNFYTENLGYAKAEDEYICDGTKQKLYPKFTYHGFRYVALEGFSKDQLAVENFTAYALSTKLPQTGSFTTSNQLINQLQSNISWGQLDNFIDIPTDCPQRSERLGWTGDVAAFGATAAFNRKVDTFFNKWLRDLASEQDLEHGVPQVVPDILHQPAAAFWGDVATILPWQLYQTYGDLSQLKQHYPIMTQWVKYIQKQTNQTGLWQSGYQYGDWLALDAEMQGLTDERNGATDRYLIANVFYANSLNLTAQAAKALGNDADETKYRQAYEKLVAKIQDEYLTKTGRLVSETQTACTLMLHFNLVPKSQRKRVLNALITNLAEHKNHITTGFVGTPFVCQVLSENGQHDLARKILLNEDCPSWLYEVKMGATTIWERWDSILPDGSFNPKNMNSLNHYAYGAIGNWLYQQLGGLKALEPGYHKFKLEPRLTPGFSKVNLTFESMYGSIHCDYECRAGKISVNVTVPVNTSAELYLPEKAEVQQLGSGEYHYEYSTDTNLEVAKYSLETPLHVVLENPTAQAFLQQAAPEMVNNKMMEYVKNEPLSGLLAYSAEARPLFEKVIELMNNEQQ